MKHVVRLIETAYKRAVESSNEVPAGAGSDDALDRLRRSEELYARAFLTNPVAMSITNLETSRFTQINLAFVELVGYQRADVIGRTSEELGLWPRRDDRDDIGRRLTAGEDVGLKRGELRPKGGALIPVLGAFRLLKLEEGAAVLSVLVPLEGQ